MVDGAAHLAAQAAREGHAALIGEEAQVQAAVALDAEAPEQIGALADHVMALDFDIFGEALRDVLGRIEAAGSATRAVVRLRAHAGDPASLCPDTDSACQARVTLDERWQLVVSVEAARVRKGPGRDSSEGLCLQADGRSSVP